MNDKTKDAGPRKLSLKSAVPAEEKLRQLKRLFPEAFDETQSPDWERIQTALGQFAETPDPSRMRYGLSWPGKNECLKIIQQASTATLRPVSDSSDAEEKKGSSVTLAQNLFIEGDNLEVLKLLQKAYYGKVKSIYIDPPYNTGKDFVYKDNWKTPLKEYLRQTGQLDENGRKTSANPETNGRRHSRWLSMMYPRLYLARNLLSDDGVIFISIDDHESHNLRHLMDEIFGQENFVAQIARKSGVAPRQDAEFFATEQDYVICYAKDREKVQINLEPVKNLDTYTLSDKHESERGKYKLNKLDRGTKQWSASLRYPITDPDGGKIWPGGREENTRWIWTWSKEKFQWGIENEFIVFKKSRGGWNVYLKQYQRVDNENKPIKRSNPPRTLLTEGFHNELATREMQELFGYRAFNYPKPVRLVEHLLRLSTNAKSDDLVMDFFAGSCTTAHAVMKLNKEDKGNRRFIMVQLPEKYPENSEAFKAGFKTIADIGKERIRRAAKQLGVSSGFKVFRLDRSNFKVWDNAPPKNVKELQKRLEMHVNHLNPKSSKEDILYEILLKAGHPLTTRIEKKEMAGTKIYSVENGKLFLCLEKLTLKAVHAMAKAEPQEVICLDSCFAGNDELKTNAHYYFKCRSTVPGDYPEILFRTV